MQQVSKAIRSELGYRPSAGKWDFSTDGTYTMGVAGIPTIGFGPGEEKHAHTTGDQIRIADVIRAAQGYARIAAEILS